MLWPFFLIALLAMIFPPFVLAKACAWMWPTMLRKTQLIVSATALPLLYVVLLIVLYIALVVEERSRTTEMLDDAPQRVLGVLVISAPVICIIAGLCGLFAGWIATSRRTK
jgi:hypothetical protein